MRNVAVAAMTKNLADELGPRGVNVTVVHPGMTRTERTPEAMAAMAQSRGTTVEELERALEGGVSIGRLVTAEEVAAVVAFLASPKSVALNGDAGRRRRRRARVDLLLTDGPPAAQMAGEGFEPSKAEPRGLQPRPFDRSGTPPGGQRV